jgi:hypothetical protein
MRDADAANRIVIGWLGLNATQYKNALMQHHLDWLEGQRTGRPWRLDDKDFVALGAWIALIQSTRLTRAQASSIAAAIRTGLRREPSASEWFISFDRGKDRWRVATSAPAETAMITINLAPIRDRIAELQAQAEATLEE